jgi:PAS domain S-box-containing protein
LIGKFVVYFNTPSCTDIEIELSLMIARQAWDRTSALKWSCANRGTLRGIVNQTVGGIAETNLTGKFIMVNNRYCEITGYTREKLLNGMRMQDITYPDDLPKNQELFGRLAVDGTSFAIEKRYVRPDGSAVWVHNSVSAITGADGKPQSAVAVVIDITERKQTEDALRQSEERFGRFMHNLPGLAWIKDVHGQYVFANAAAEKAFNTPPEKLYGRIDAEIFPPEVAVQFKQNDELVLASEKGVQTVETLGQEDGILHYSLVTKFPIPSPDGQTTLIGGTAFDITERLQAEEALRESEARFRPG